MPPIILNLKKIPDPRDAVHRAVEALAAGRVVALPTETVYGVAVSALQLNSVQRLYELKNRPQTFPLAFFVKSDDDALDFVPDMSPLARRLARKCWPGPLTMLFPGPHPDSVITRLPDEIQKLACGSGWVGLRVPADPLAMEVLRLNAGPILMANSGTNEAEPAATAIELIEGVGAALDLVLDAGPCRFGQPSTVIKLWDDQIEIVRRGVIDEQSLKRMSEVNILIVCTGNTCRSPMAEGLLKKRLADQLQCSVEALGDWGFNVESAGVAAMPGGGVSAEAVEALKLKDIDISQHSSQPVTERLVQQADLILTMTQGHLRSLVGQWPQAATRAFTLGQDQGDIADPIGLPREYYEQCAQQIDHCLQRWIESNPLFKS